MSIATIYTGEHYNWCYVVLLLGCLSCSQVQSCTLYVPVRKKEIRCEREREKERERERERRRERERESERKSEREREGEREREP